MIIDSVEGYYGIKDKYTKKNMSHYRWYIYVDRKHKTIIYFILDV